MVVVMGAGDDSASFKLDRQSDGDNANIEADLIITMAGNGGKDALTADVGRIDHARFALHFIGGAGNDQGTVNLLGDLDAAAATLFMDGGLGNDSLTAIANGIDIDEESSLTVVQIGSFGFDTNVAVFAGELDGLLLVRSLGDADRDNVVANLITADDSDGQLDAIIRGGANTVLPGGAVLLDVVVLTVKVDPNEVTVLNLQQLQD